MSKAKVALVGLGYWGPKIARNISKVPNTELSWIVDSNSKSLAEASSDFPTAKVSQDISQMLLDDAVDAVMIATPAATHAKLIEHCLMSGKHVFVEKPLSTSHHDAEKLTQLADSLGLVLMVGHTFVYNQAVRDTRQLILEGKLGDIQHLDFVRTNLGIVRPDTNVVWDLASHDVSISMWLLRTKPLAVSAQGATWINPGRVDTASIALHFPNNVLATIYVSWLSPKRVRELSVVGSEKMLTLDDTNQATPLLLHSKTISGELTHFMRNGHSETVRITSLDEGTVELPFDWKEPLFEECLHFIDSITSQTSPETSGQFGSDVVEVLSSIDVSLQNKGALIELQ